MPPRDAPYDRYARHYDAIGQSAFGLRSVIHLLHLLDDCSFRPGSVLDIACGTGAVAIELARQGLRVGGLDRSPAMLDIARADADAAHVEVTWLEADMTSFAIAESVDLCTCWYDAVNYLPDRSALLGFLQSAASALRHGGYLAFDINTRKKLAEHWDDSTIVAADDGDRFLVYRSWYDNQSESSPLLVTGFERTTNGSWERFDEEHIEYVFAIADIVDALQQSGFAQIEVLEWGEVGMRERRLGTESSFRVLFLAQWTA